MSDVRRPNEYRLNNLLFSFFTAKTSVKKDLSEKWDDLWAKHQNRVVQVEQQQQDNSGDNCCPQSLRMASLLFEITPQEQQITGASVEENETMKPSN